MSEYPTDWPGSGPIDLRVHDRPHASSTTEWWYQNAHVTTADSRSFGLFASFFRIVKGRDPKTGITNHAHSLTWALTDISGKRYLSCSRVDQDAAKMGLERLNRGEGTRDPRLRRAIRDVLEAGRLPLPDRRFEAPVFVDTSRLELDFEGATFTKGDDGAYTLHLHDPRTNAGCDLVFTPKIAPVRHGDNGVVRGAFGEDMFYYFIPRCDIRGTITVDGVRTEVASGRGWYDHEFGGMHHAKAVAESPKSNSISWNWTAVQLDDDHEISLYTLVDADTGANRGRRAIVVDPAGRRHAYEDVRFEPEGEWRSTRTFTAYPTRWRASIPGAKLELVLDSSLEDQEFITLISKPAFWEGRCEVTGTRDGAPVKGRAYIERSGFSEIDDLDSFFGAVGKEVRKSVAAMLPLQPTYEQARKLVASDARDQYMDGVDVDQFARTYIKPIREITDRGGKSWRSYAALACCDIVGGDSRRFVQWLALPELMHVGSLIVDDVQDRSTVRRGGATCHVLHGEALAINAGTACYFLGQPLLVDPNISDADKLKLYDLYFEVLRAGHAGQALDIDGLATLMPDVVERGEGANLERRVLAIHRLKTAAPAGSLARMGAIAGKGSKAQVEALGRFFESLGLAFQIIDDVLNLRGFRGDLKSRGEDISHGKVTLPIAKAIAVLPLEERRRLWATIASKPTDAAVITAAVQTIEGAGALDACEAQARTLVETAWAELDPLVDDSLSKLMLRAFGWYVLERHY